MDLAQAAYAMGVGKMIYTSSAGIVGLQSKGEGRLSTDLQMSKENL
jgi:hypothetical protein